MKANEIELAKKNGTIGRIKAKLVDDKISEKYSVSHQIAILRQKEEKPEEFKEFYAFAEKCKEEVNTELGIK